MLSGVSPPLTEEETGLIELIPFSGVLQTADFSGEVMSSPQAVRLVFKIVELFRSRSRAFEAHSTLRHVSCYPSIAID
jgi:hypothetical protein